LRIVAGSRKGARIFAPRGADTRPTADRVREAAFNLIGPVEDMAVLDLFAGSGAMGIEALSRGASRAVFVESDRAPSEAIKRNLEKLRLTGAVVVRADALSALAAETAANRRYDLVLVDPPYEMFSSLQTGLARYVPAVLEPGALVVVETAASEEPELPLPKRTSRRYGSARLTVFERGEGQSPSAGEPSAGTVPTSDA
jgi:16S rRNA (guanine966-N2)-methyltransferase